MKHRILLCLLLGSLLAACSKPESETAPAATPPTSAAATPPTTITADNQGVLTNNQRDALNAANQLGNTLEQADAERRKQMEAQGL